MIPSAAWRALGAAALTFALAVVTNSPAAAQTPNCTLSVTPTSVVYSELGQSRRSIAVTVPSQACAWSANTNANWITIVSGTGQGNGTVFYDVAPNTGTTARQGTITVTVVGAAASATTTIVQRAAFAMSCSPTTGPSQTGVFYSATCSATGGASPYTFTNSTLPPGLSFSIVSGSGVISGTPTAAGSYSYTIRATDSTVPPQSATVTFSGTIVAAASSTSLSVSPSPSTLGQTVTLTALVSPSAATGTVTFIDGQTTLGSATLISGVASLQTATLSVGNHSLIARYGGDSSRNASTSQTVTHTVNRIPTNTTLTATPASITPGQTATLTATVSPSTATGTVIFRDGTLTVGTGTLANGTATVSVSPTAIGSHSLTAAYGGDNNHAPSTSAAANLTVGRGATTTSLGVSPNPASPGQTVTMVATVAPSNATGTVTFLDGTTALGSAALSNGTATLSTTSLSVGSHTLTASYSGDANNSPSVSSAVTEVVNRRSSTTTLTASPNPASPGQSVTMVATVAPSNATGTVTFLDGTTALGSAALSNGAATLSTTGLSLGSHALTAAYSGDANNGPSVSSAVTEVVNRTSSTTTLTASPNPASPGQPVTMVASVAPANATGTVTFLDGTTALGSAGLSNGAAAFSTTGLSVGSHALTAAYSGDANNGPSVSSAVTEVVNRASSTTTLTASPTAATPGQTVTLTATVSPSNATGTVAFVDGSVTLATVSLANGAASFSTSSLSTGSHSVTATYSGNSTLNSSTSSAVAVVIGQGNSATSLSVTPNPARVGQQVTLVALVTPFTATGTVTFRDGTATISSMTLTSGGATLVTAFQSAGEHALTATYSGDANIGPSTSNSVVEVITPATTETTTTLSAAPNPATFGQPVTMTAVVSPSSASGTVTFTDGGTALGTASLNSGAATFTSSTLRVGSHSLQASYSGGGANGPSQSAAVTLVIGAAPTTTTLSVAPPASSPGQSVTLTAVVAPSAATGSVTFRDGFASLGTANLVNGTATLSTSALTAGNHTLSAVYAGDGNFASSTSNTATASVGLTSTATALSVTPLSSTFGQTVTLTAAVTPSAATGTVTFRDGSTTLGTATLSGGTATFTTSSLAAGSHSLTAQYGGDSTNGASTSTSVAATVARAASTVVLTAAPSPSSPGQTVTLTARVTPSNATGNVSFLDGQTTLGSAALSGGSAVLTTASLAAGSHTLSAAYGGDANTASATSANVSHNVVSSSAVQISSPASLAPAFAGVSYSQTLRATGGTPPYTWTLASNTTPDLGLANSGDDGILSGTPRTAGSFQVTVRVQDSAGQANAAVFTLTVHALPAVTLSVTQPATITDQPAPRLTLAQSYPFALTGVFTLTFAPNAAGLPAGYIGARFSTGGTTFQVTIPANSTTPTPAIPAIQLGTVAGEITGTLGGLTMTGSTLPVPFPGQAPTVRITVPRLAPVIVPGSVRIVSVAATAFQVTLDASSTPRDLTGGAFVFTAASGTQLSGCTPNCTVPFASDAAAWFASSAGVANGGAYSLTVPFTFTGDASAIGTVSVTLTNSAGASAAVSGGR